MANKLSFSIALNLLTDNFKKGAKTFKNSLRSMQMQVLTFAAALGAGGLGIAGMLSRFKDVARETSRVTTALKNVSGGTSAFADNLQYINELAKKYGLEVNGLMSNFAKFTASATQANMPMKDQQKIFESLSKASAAFSLSGAETDGVFLALSQMMGKGKISMEELRKQMGEKLPIAMSAMAKALGVSMGEMDKLISSGKVMSADVLPKFADALNDMMPTIDTDNLESSLNRLSNAFTNIVSSSGFQSKYKTLIDGLTSLLKTASENIRNIALGAITAVVFAFTNGATKIWRGWWSIADNMTNTTRSLNVALTKATADRVAAENVLETSRLKHSVAIGNAKLKLAQEVTLKEKLYARSVLAEDRARLAFTQASSKASSTLWTRSLNTIKVGAAKLGLALKSLWSSFAPAIIISALVAIGGYFKNLYDEAKRIKNIFSEYKKEANSAGNTQEVVMLQKQLSIMNDKTRSQKEINAAQEVLQKMLGNEKLSQEEINKQISKRIELLKEAARADYYAQKVVSTENTIKELASSVGLSEDQVKKLAKTRGDLGNGSSFDVANKSRKITGDNNYYQQIGAAYRENGVKGAYDLSAADDAVKQIVEHLRVLDDANTELGDAVNKSNTLTINTFTTPTDPDKKKDNRQKVIDNQLKLQNAKARAELDARNKELDNQQAELDLEEEGYNKQQKQIDLNHAKELLGIEKRTQELIEKKQESERQIWEIEHPDADKKKEVFTPKTKSYADLSDADKSNLIIADDQANRRKEKAETELLKNTLAKYQDYNAKRVELEIDYNKKIAELESQRGKGSDEEINRAITEAKKQYSNALSSINIDELKDSIDWQSVFGNLDKVSTEAIESLRDKLKKYLAEAGSSLSISGLKDLTEALEQLDQKYAQLRPNKVFNEGLKEFKDATENIKRLKKELKEIQNGKIKMHFEYDEKTDKIRPVIETAKEAEEKLTEAQLKRREALNKIGDSLQGASNKMHDYVDLGREVASTFEDFGGKIPEDLQMTLDGLGKINDGMSDLAEGAKNNNVIQMITGGVKALGGIAKTVKGIFGENAKKAHRQALRFLEAQRKELLRIVALEKLRESLNYKAGDTVFGSDKWGKARNGAVVYAESLKKLKDSLNELEDVDVVTGHKKGGLFKKGKDRWSDLLSTYPDLINKNGEFDKTLAQTIVTTQKLSEEGKKSINNAIENATLVEDAYAVMKDHLTGIFGDLGNVITNTFVDAFKNGTDAVKLATEDISKMLENLAIEKIYSTTLAPIKEEYSQKMMDISSNTNMTDEKKYDAYIDLIASAKDEIFAKQETFKKGLELMKQKGNEKGIDLFSPDKSTTQDSSKGYSTTMDQDTGGAILGRITGLHETGLRIEGFLKGLSINTSSYISSSTAIVSEIKKQTDILNDSFQIHKKSYNKMDSIIQAVAPMAEMKTKLDQIEKNTKGLISKR